MSLVKTEAFVIRAIKYSDTSRILTLLTKELGKISAIHKGSRKNSKSGNTGSFSCFEAMIYYKESRDLQLLSQIHSLYVFKNIETDIERLRVAYIVQELINRCTPSNTPNREIFDSVNGFFQGIDSMQRYPEIELLRFLMGLAESLGIVPESNFEGFETFFAKSGFTLCRSEVEFLMMLKYAKSEEFSGTGMYADLSKLCKFYEHHLLENSIGTRFQKARNVFEQF